MIALTMLLSILAVKFIIVDKLPADSTLTLLDRFVLQAFYSIVAATGVSVVIGGVRDMDNQQDKLAFVICIAIWTAVQVPWVVYVILLEMRQSQRTALFWYPDDVAYVKHADVNLLDSNTVQPHDRCLSRTNIMNSSHKKKTAAAVHSGHPVLMQWSREDIVHRIFVDPDSRNPVVCKSLGRLALIKNVPRKPFWLVQFKNEESCAACIKQFPSKVELCIPAYREMYERLHRHGVSEKPQRALQVLRQESTATITTQLEGDTMFTEEKAFASNQVAWMGTHRATAQADRGMAVGSAHEQPHFDDILAEVEV
eukprot:m.272944 g.272944  ORF g.272944 m.272944 type:complete len:311 (+) comp22848_c0_seq14:157-1089(+)